MAAQMKPSLGIVREPKGQEGAIPSGQVKLPGELIVPTGAKGMVLFAHGSGSSRHSPRNQQVARILRKAGLATLLFDLLTAEEEEQDMKTRHLRFDIERLAGRLLDASTWILGRPETRHLRLGYFGASTGAAAAVLTAAQLGEKVGAIVSRGGRPDLAGQALPQVTAPTLFIVGERDETVRGLNEQALAKLRCEKEMKIIPRATHLFEEPGTLEEAARLAASWFDRYLQPSARSPS
jgi:putative phosphoribosyl transferase